MEVLLVFLIIGAIIGFVVFMISWSIHIDMVKGENKPYDWCTFKTFKKEFNKYKNHPNLETGGYCGKSIFCKEQFGKYVVYLHASVIKFDEKCMILYPHSWLRYCVWMKSFNKPKNRQRGLWK